KDLDAVRVEPAPTMEHFAPPLGDLFRERMNQPAPVWIAGHSDQWDKTILHTWLLTQPPQEQEALGKLRTFGVWLTFGREVTVNAAAACADAAAAEPLRAFLHGRAAPVLRGGRVVGNAD